MYLIGFANRIVVAVRWAWSFLTHGRGSRLITGQPLVPDIEDPGTDASVRTSVPTKATEAPTTPPKAKKTPTKATKPPPKPDGNGAAPRVDEPTVSRS